MHKGRYNSAPCNKIDLGLKLKIEGHRNFKADFASLTCKIFV